MPPSPRVGRTATYQDRPLGPSSVHQGFLLKNLPVNFGTCHVTFPALHESAEQI